MAVRSVAEGRRRERKGGIQEFGCELVGIIKEEVRQNLIAGRLFERVTRIRGERRIGSVNDQLGILGKLEIRV